MINLRYTKDVQDGPLKGAQLRTAIKCDDAQEAVSWMLLISDGVQHDLMIGAGYIARNFTFETELSHDLGECVVDECQFCKEAAADAAYDLREGF